MDIRLKLRKGSGLDDNILQWLEGLNISSRQASTVIKLKLNEVIERAPGRIEPNNTHKAILSVPESPVDELEKKVSGFEKIFQDTISG